MRKRRPIWVASLAGLMWMLACGPNQALWEPTPEVVSTEAPDSFVVEIETSEGSFQVKMIREWSPLGVDRAYHLMRNDFYAGARLYRVLPEFVAQWGFSGNPALDSIWEDRTLEDEPAVASNVRGTVSFARAGRRTRNFTLFINLVDNERLDGLLSGGVVGYPPIGRIEQGLEVVDGFYAGYQNDPPFQDSLEIRGNAYLRQSYPQLDSIVSTRVITGWP